MSQLGRPTSTNVYEWIGYAERLEAIIDALNCDVIAREARIEALYCIIDKLSEAERSAPGQG